MPLILPRVSNRQRLQQPWKFRLVPATWQKRKAGQRAWSGPPGFQLPENDSHMLGKQYRKVSEANVMLIKKQNKARTTCTQLYR